MELGLTPLFLVGLLGSVHCAGMCGGIVGALSLGPRRMGSAGAAGAGPAVMTLRPAVATPALLQVAAYNGGRIASYMAAGALAGGAAGLLGRGAAALALLPPLQTAAFVLANLMLVALGLHLMGAWSGIAHVERAGRLVWERVRPWLARVGPLDTPGRLFAAGALWGWLPCAMVYSVLVTAMLSGSATRGALAMLAFGLGTLPMMLGLGLLGARLRAWLRLAPVRVGCGGLVLGFGLAGLARAGGLPAGWLGLLCVSPGAMA